jgi:hypothetical protein
VGWLLLVALGIIWAAFLLPTREGSLNRSIEDFERNMDLLADTEGHRRGRWIVTPRKGMAFVGTRERARERARVRRRRVFVVMFESTVIAFMIGLVPPLRAMWFVAGGLMILLGLYVWLLMKLKDRATSRAATAARHPVRANGHASVANGNGRPSSNGHGRASSNGHGRASSNGHGRASSNGHTSFDDDELLNIVVRPARERKRDAADRIGAARV